MKGKKSAESVVKDIRLKTRKKYSAEEKIRIVLCRLHSKPAPHCNSSQQGIALQNSMLPH
ncbi:MAG TPA: hypothetical protein VJ987_11920 [Anaerolineales bacterium]|nr:hypothetical protein [Anaerolineales bacterium]